MFNRTYCDDKPNYIIVYKECIEYNGVEYAKPHNVENFLYNKGYRIFIGYVDTNIILKNLEWFRYHSTVTVITPAALTERVNEIKNVVQC
jgi:hypothetical protein